MELFARLFGGLLLFVYHCFDRLVIHGYLSGLSRPEQVVYFFREVVGVPVIQMAVWSANRISVDLSRVLTRGLGVGTEWGYGRYCPKIVEPRENRTNQPSRRPSLLADRRPVGSRRLVSAPSRSKERNMTGRKRNASESKPSRDPESETVRRSGLARR